MKNAALLAVIIAALVFSAAACGSSRQAAVTQATPKWVTNAEGLVCAFVDNWSQATATIMA